MNLIDVKVTHIKFGVGRVLRNDNGRIAIRFSDDVGQKIFLYPEGFEHYLKMCNPSIQNIVDAELKLKLDQIAVEKARQEQRRMEEANRLAEEKATRRKPSAKKSTQSKGKRSY